LPLTADSLISRIDEEVSRQAALGDPAAEARRHGLLRIRDVLERVGLAARLDQRRDLSLVPSLLQEANYDDIDWTDRTAPLAQLSELFEIDVAVQSNGRERHELTDSEYDDYVRMSLAAIEQR